MQVLTFVSAFTRVKPRAHIGTLADLGTFACTRRFARTGAFARRKAPQSPWQPAADSPMRPPASRKRSLHPVDNAGHDDSGEF